MKKWKKENEKVRKDEDEMEEKEEGTEGRIKRC